MKPARKEKKQEPGVLNCLLGYVWLGWVRFDVRFCLSSSAFILHTIFTCQ